MGSDRVPESEQDDLYRFMAKAASGTPGDRSEALVAHLNYPDYNSLPDSGVIEGGVMNWAQSTVDGNSGRWKWGNLSIDGVTPVKPERNTGGGKIFVNVSIAPRTQISAATGSETLSAAPQMQFMGIATDQWDQLTVAERAQLQMDAARAVESTLGPSGGKVIFLPDEDDE